MSKRRFTFKEKIALVQKIKDEFANGTYASTELACEANGLSRKKYHNWTYEIKRFERGLVPRPTGPKIKTVDFNKDFHAPLGKTDDASRLPSFGVDEGGLVTALLFRGSPPDIARMFRAFDEGGAWK